MRSHISLLICTLALITSCASTDPIRDEAYNGRMVYITYDRVDLKMSKVLARADAYCKKANRSAQLVFIKQIGNVAVQQAVFKCVE